MTYSWYMGSGYQIRMKQDPDDVKQLSAYVLNFVDMGLNFLGKVKGFLQKRV